MPSLLLILCLVSPLLCTRLAHRLRQEYQGASRLETPKAMDLNDHYGYVPSNSIYNPTQTILHTYSPVSNSNYLRITSTPLHQPDLYPSDCSTVYKSQYDLCMSATSCQACLVNDSICSWCRLGDRCFPTQVKASNCDQLCSTSHQETDSKQCILPKIMNPGALRSVSKEATDLVPAEYAMGQTLEIHNDREGYGRQYVNTSQWVGNTTLQDVRVYSPSGSHVSTTLNYSLNLTTHHYNYTRANQINTLQFQQPPSSLSHVYPSSLSHVYPSSLPDVHPSDPPSVLPILSSEQQDQMVDDQVTRLEEQHHTAALKQAMEESELRVRESGREIQRG